MSRKPWILSLAAFVLASGCGVGYSEEAEESCNRLNDLLSGEKDPGEIAKYAPVAGEVGLMDAIEDRCGADLAEARSIKADYEDDVESDLEDDQADEDLQEPTDSLDTYLDPNVSLLEKQCLAAVEVLAAGNGPDSPFSDYTDEDLAISQRFLDENC